MNRKVQRQKDNLELVRQQIKAIDQRNREAIKGKLAEKKVASPSKERKDQSVDTVSDGNEDTDQSVSQEAKTD
jgi:hypothetical protein